ncbi:hypothetical protein BJ973_003422 [Actinoplanes tereljensis]|uniref:Uncharacterized protein n=1 Tax=Paractinoplanes tereljensis TaxID=571912 RepID=A0A919TZR0_9ACTN|nr:hypothetical protein [Actinoplanes tereljensis]GIF26152.1 hypothetical protein Ate02nite_88820 [Actinoplanes tereljensis]
MVIFRARRTLIGLAVVAALAGGCSSGEDTSTSAVPEFVPPSATADTSASAPARTEAGPATPTPSIKPKPTTGKPQPNVTWTPTSKPSKPKPVPAATTVKPGEAQKNIKENAFCSPIGGLGYTKAKKKLTCILKPGDERSLWRVA